MERTWRHKAEQVIFTIAFREWEKVNRLPNGRIRKKHKKYTLPDECHALVEALGRNDEQTAKEVMELMRIRGISID